MFDDAQYQPLLLKLARVLQLKGAAAKPYDFVDLDTLRGDTLLQTKQQASAIASLNDAIKLTTDQTDPQLIHGAILPGRGVRVRRCLPSPPSRSRRPPCCSCVTTRTRHPDVHRCRSSCSAGSWAWRSRAA